VTPPELQEFLARIAGTLTGAPKAVLLRFEGRLHEVTGASAQVCPDGAYVVLDAGRDTGRVPLELLPDAARRP